ncbi:hypothetical protein C0J45_7943 [Silurus meridionalis]|nr:hypothetical protein C0J45_7943 [Silurus meridionalis]
MNIDTLFDMTSKCCANYEAYFGNGTKLTVLDPNISITKPASVKVLSVSEKETCTKTNVTLVCVAKGFYPDHVNVYWTDDNGNRSTDVSTDEIATRNGSFYSITSRLNINYKTEWTKGLTFTCNVVFFDGTEYSTHSDSETGPKIESDGEYAAETYVRKVKTTMLGYSMFIAQSLIYGLIILVIVKRQVKSLHLRYCNYHYNVTGHTKDSYYVQLNHIIFSFFSVAQGKSK